MKLSPAPQVPWTFLKGVAIAMALATAPAVGCSSSSSPSTGAPGPDASGTTGDGGEAADGASSSSDANPGDAHDGQASGDAHSDGAAQPGTDAGGDAPAGATGVAFLCGATCNRLATCSGTTVTDAAACSCSASATGSQFYLYRGDYVAAVAACITTEPCLELLADGGSPDGGAPDCVTSALAGVTPSAEVASLCTAIVNSSCASDATTDCSNTFKAYSDATITALSACIADPNCNNHTTCLETALGQ